MKQSRVLILGANSDIAVALARQMAQLGTSLYLASRNIDELEREAANLRTRYDADVTAIRFDATDYESHPDFYADLDPAPDGVVLAFGLLADQKACGEDFGQARAVMETNYTGAARILELVAADFEKRKKTAENDEEIAGTAAANRFIVGISSVAGDRGRADNYTYGSAKAGFTSLLSGLRQRLHPHGVQVLTVKPGFVATKMTAGKPLPKHLTADPETVAGAILKGIRKKKDVIYTRPVWRVIMSVIRHIPEPVFKRMRF